MLCVVVEAGGRRTKVPFAGDQVRIGTAPDNELVVDSAFVSRHHCVLTRSGAGEIQVQDLGSLNGTRSDGRRVKHERFRAPFSLQLGGDVVATVTTVDSDEVDLSPDVQAGGRAPSPKEGGKETSPVSGPLDLLADLAVTLCDGFVAGDVDERFLVDAVVTAMRARGAAYLQVPLLRSRPVLLMHVATEVLDWPDADLVEDVRARLERGAVAIELLDHAAPPTWFVSRRHGERTDAIVVAGCDAAAARIVGRVLSAVGPRAQQAEREPAAEREAFDLTAAGPGVVSPRGSAVTALHERMAGAVTSSLPILLVGKTGVGKELYARALHFQSARRQGPFRAVNSSAIPETLLEAMLFGAEEGAATGVKRQPGLLREALGGTFFLDEIGEMSASLQSKLLRVLEEGSVLPVGATRPVPIDVRFVAATNRDLRAEVAAGRFREDLYHRLRGHEFVLPELREHAEDVPRYVDAFLRDECERAGRHVPGVTVKAMAMLRSYPWPGNVRELGATVRRLVHELPPGAPITHEDLPLEVQGCEAPARATGAHLEEALDALRRSQIVAALEACEGNRSAAADRLGLSRGGLRKLMRRLGLDES